MSGFLAQADEIARPFREETRAAVAALGAPITLRGILASERRASEVYADYTRKGCDAVGIRFELEHAPKLEVEDLIARANEDAGVHGVIVYYPVFGGERDRTLQDVI